MDILNLSKDELLKIREDIDNQITYIDELQGKEKLSELRRGDRIFAMNFTHDGHIHNMDYVDIILFMRDDGLMGFSTSHPTKPMGCSATTEADCMGRHYFLSEFSSSMYFFTLRPHTWKTDIKSELPRIIKIRDEQHRKEIQKFTDNINNIIKMNQ
jgi:hypothetical protein